MFKALNKWRQTRTTVTELSHLTDRELTDIGITRADIYRVAREHTRNTNPR